MGLSNEAGLTSKLFPSSELVSLEIVIIAAACGFLRLVHLPVLNPRHL